MIPFKMNEQLWEDQTNLRALSQISILSFPSTSTNATLRLETLLHTLLIFRSSQIGVLLQKLR